MWVRLVSGLLSRGYVWRVFLESLQRHVLESALERSIGTESDIYWKRPVVTRIERNRIAARQQALALVLDEQPHVARVYRFGTRVGVCV